MASGLKVGYLVGDMSFEGDDFVGARVGVSKASVGVCVGVLTGAIVGCNTYDVGSCDIVGTAVG